MSSKMEYTQKQSASTNFKRVKIALIGEGQVHGEDDAITMRPYQASMTCTKSGSELLILSRVDFYRTFKGSSLCWNHSLLQAKLKENEYIKRCRQYLDIKELVIKESSDAAMK